MSKNELDVLAAKINKKYGKTVVTTADKVPDVYYTRRPSGIMQLDIDTAGGLPAGTVHYLSGPDSAGKTDLLYRYMAWQQRIHKQDSYLALAAVEHPLDHFRLRRLGVMVPIPNERIEMEQSDRKERGVPLLSKSEIKDLQTGIGTFMPIQAGNMEDTLDVVLELLQFKKFHIIGVDSITALIPKDIQSKDLDEDARRGVHAMCMTKFFAKYYPLVTRLDGDPVTTTLIFTQQVRANEKKSQAPSYMAKWLPDYASGGAWAAKHGKCFDIVISPGARTKDKGGDDTKKQVISKMLQWEIAKGKAGSHEGIYGEVEFDFNTLRNIDYEETVMIAGVKWGILQIRDKEKLVTWIKGTEAHKKYADIPLADFKKLLQNDFEVDYMLRRDILAAAGISCSYR